MPLKAWLWLGLASLGCAQDITGIVTDEVTGAPVVGASLRVYRAGMPGGRKPDGWIPVGSGEDGRFRASNLAAGRYWVECSAIGYLEGCSDSEVRIEADGTVVPALLRLRMKPAVMLEGRVVTEDGRPVSGAVVIRNVDGKRMRTETDSDGSFALIGLPGCDRACVVIVEAGEEAWKPFLREAGRRGLAGRYEIVVTPWSPGQHVQDVVLRLAYQPLFVFSGVVIDAAPEDAMVRLVPEGFDREDAVARVPLVKGRFAFAGLARGEYRLVVAGTAPGEVPVRLENDLVDQRIQLPAPLRLEGVVRLRGKPFAREGLRVLLSRRFERGFQRALGVVGPDGSFTVDGLAPGEWSLQVPLPAMRSSRHSVEVVEGQNAALVVDLEETFVVSGRILEQADGSPVVGSLVLVGDARTWMVLPTDDAGRFDARVGSGMYRMTAWRKGDGADVKQLPACSSARQVEIRGDLHNLEVPVCR